jgi:preprotein translocase subunit SecG
MTLIFFILIVVACFVLGLVVLVQNPKGGGLSGTFGGFSNQLMGVKQTTDVLEKGTWIFAAVIGVLCIISTSFLKGGTTNTINTKELPTINSQTAPSNPATTPAPNTAKPK